MSRNAARAVNSQYQRKKAKFPRNELMNVLFICRPSLRGGPAEGWSLLSYAHTLLNLSMGPPRLIKCLYTLQLVYGLLLLFSCAETAAFVPQNSGAVSFSPLL